MTIAEMRAALIAAGFDLTGKTDATIVDLWAAQAGPIGGTVAPVPTSTGGFAGHRRTIVDAAFGNFGQDARWGEDGQIVRVRFRAGDDNDRLDQGRVSVRGLRLQVRSWEVERPVPGSAIVLLPTETQPAERTLRSFGEPVLDERGVWQVTAREAA